MLIDQKKGTAYSINSQNKILRSISQFGFWLKKGVSIYFMCVISSSETLARLTVVQAICFWPFLFNEWSWVWTRANHWFTKNIAEGISWKVNWEGVKSQVSWNRFLEMRADRLSLLTYITIPRLVFYYGSSSFAGAGVPTHKCNKNDYKYRSCCYPYPWRGIPFRCLGCTGGCFSSYTLIACLRPKHYLKTSK